MLLTATRNHFNKLFLDMTFETFIDTYGIMPLFNSTLENDQWVINDDHDKKINITYAQLEIIADGLAKHIHKHFNRHADVYIYGIPRGGAPVACLLLRALNNSIYHLTADVTKANIIIDDVVDSGKTKTDALLKNPKAKFYGFFTRPSNWVVFPFEGSESASIDDAFIRLSQYYNIKDSNFELFKDDVDKYITNIHCV